MPTPQKEQVVKEFEKEAREAKGLVITTYKGLKTTEFNEFRAKIRAQKSEYRVVKNSLTKIALKNAGMAALADALQGPSAVVIERGDPMPIIKALFDFVKTHDAIKVNGGVLDGKILTGPQLKAIASLPSREVMVAILLGTMQAPLVNLVSVLQAPMRDLVGVLDQIAKKAPESK